MFTLAVTIAKILLGRGFEYYCRCSQSYTMCITEGREPESYEEAMGDENKMNRVDVMQDEMKSLHENHSFELVKLPKGKIF